MQVTLGFSLKIEETSKWRCYICNFSLRISKKKKKKVIKEYFPCSATVYGNKDSQNV